MALSTRKSALQVSKQVGHGFHLMLHAHGQACMVSCLEHQARCWCRVNSTEVVLAAIWDLLTMQCDRHGQNVFIDEHGSLTLIDLDQAFGDAWRVCGVDSLFLPTTQKYMINLLGYWYVMKHHKHPQRSISPQIWLDYRCHAEGGAIGRRYPPRVQQCLEAISSMQPVQVPPAIPKLDIIWHGQNGHGTNA
jgi:hypothetical protein